jgi:hypothetical protein
MEDEKLARGQRVNVEIDGRQVDSIFVRAAAPREVTGDKGAAVSGERGVAELAWVRRSDTGEVEPVESRLISAI